MTMVITIGLGDVILLRNDNPRDLFLYNDDCHYKEHSRDNQVDLLFAILRYQQQ